MTTPTIQLSVRLVASRKAASFSTCGYLRPYLAATSHTSIDLRLMPSALATSGSRPQTVLGWLT